MLCLSRSSVETLWCSHSLLGVVFHTHMRVAVLCLPPGKVSVWPRVLSRHGVPSVPLRVIMSPGLVVDDGRGMTSRDEGGFQERRGLLS